MEPSYNEMEFNVARRPNALLKPIMEEMDELLLNKYPKAQSEAEKKELGKHWVRNYAEMMVMMSESFCIKENGGEICIYTFLRQEGK